MGWREGGKGREEGGLEGRREGHGFIASMQHHSGILSTQRRTEASGAGGNV